MGGGGNGEEGVRGELKEGGGSGGLSARPERHCLQ